MSCWRNIFVMLVLMGSGVVLGDGPTTTQATLSPAVGVQHWFGVAVENIPPAIARQLKLKPEQGLMVAAVLPGSPAEGAGLRQYDLLIELNGMPLTSQEELARAANWVDATGGMKTSRIAYLRDGDRAVADVTPRIRPLNMLVLGNNVGSFVGQVRNAEDGAGAMRAADVRNYVLPNGAAAQVGPGYRVDLGSGDPSTLTLKSIKGIVDQGKTITLIQETDLNGAVRNTITVGGGKTYPVEMGRLEALPEELRPFGEQMLENVQTPAQPSISGVTTAPSEEVSLEERVAELEKENQKLQGELAELLKKDKAGK